jgi:hypothetical protein
MNWSNGGDFTKNLLSLQMQLQTLLEGVGGEETAGLLDGLAKLSETERSILIPLVTRVINKVVMGEHRLMSEKDKELKEFEDSLFEGVLAALQQPEAPNGSTKEKSPRLAVVPGGRSPKQPLTLKKPVRIPTLIDLTKARESRRGGRSDSYPNDLA